MEFYMKRFLLFFLCGYSGLIANEASRQEYLTLIQSHPEVVMPIGSAAKGEIEILLDPNKMTAIEEATVKWTQPFRPKDH